MDRNFHFYNAANILVAAFPVIAGSAFTQFDPNFEEVRDGVEPWLMARWKARVAFLLSAIEVLFLSLTVEALQSKTCQNSPLIGGIGQFAPRFQGKGVVPREYFLASTKLDTFCYLSANCTVLRAVVLKQYRRVTDGQTDRQTDGIAVASTALAM